MNLARALRTSREARVAFAGAGGKTTALFQLARSVEPPVVVTCSTHIGTWQAELADRHLVITRPDDIERFTGQIEGVTLITGPEGEEQRLQGLDADTLSVVNDLAGQLGFPVLVEADGSRQKPLKAPADHEPVIPAWINTAVIVVGLSALEQPLKAEVVHRPERFAELSGLDMGQTVSGESIARMLIHSQGGLKNIPENARKVALLNQADQDALAKAGIRIANQISHYFDSVLITALSDHRIWQVIEPVGGILLAGGSSSRFGQPKMLLPWRGKPLIRHVAENALGAGLEALVVVTGAVDQPVRQALAGLPVVIAHNADWQQGQSTSIRTGLRALPANTGAAVFLLADQPFVTSDLLSEMIRRYRSTLAPVTAPRVSGQRANPVLFDRDLFAGLMELEGDTGGRVLLGKYPVDYIEWGDDRLIADIDTPEDYERLKGAE
jgi:molybdenum cofactor cytidylyltransferase